MTFPAVRGGTRAVPRAIADTVIRGVLDLLKEWAQTDKGMAEEQSVPSWGRGCQW
jgi:hypothetical protein